MKDRKNFRIVSQFFGVDPRRKNPRRIVSPIPILLICLSVFGSGCAPQASVTCPGDATGDYLVDEIKFEGMRIDPAIRLGQGLLPADEFWFSSADTKTLDYGWDNALMRMRRGSVDSCNYANPSQNCIECNLCTGVCNPGGAPVLPGLPAGSLEKTDAGGQSQILHTFSTVRHGCLTQPTPRPSPAPVEAEDNVTYSLTRSDSICPDGTGMVETVNLKTHVVNTTKTITRNMKPHRCAVGANQPPRFKFSVPVTNGVLRENFSSSLKITRVRVLLGKGDPHTMGNMEPLKDDATLLKVRPSRLLFLTDFSEDPARCDIDLLTSEDRNRCQANVSENDGKFDMEECPRDASPDTRVVRFHATPTYLFGSPTLTLTWMIEYRNPDGTPAASPFGENEFPVLEFTIEKVEQ